MHTRWPSFPFQVVENLFCQEVCSSTCSLFTVSNFIYVPLSIRLVQAEELGNLCLSKKEKILLLLKPYRILLVQRLLVGLLIEIPYAHGCVDVFPTKIHEFLKCFVHVMKLQAGSVHHSIYDFLLACILLQTISYFWSLFWFLSIVRLSYGC